MESLVILIAADLGPTETNYHQFSTGDIDSLVDNGLLEQLSLADYRIFNLEVPLTESETPISKDGPSLKAPISAINGIARLNPSVVTLANNHIYDYGEQGLLDTISCLSANSIQFVGAGENLAEASRPVILEKGSFKIGIYACTEHEFSIADTEQSGANPIDFLESFDHISELKSRCDYVMVLHHGGKEYYRYPSPELQRTCRKMVNAGADLVICQHSHCVGSYEKFNEGVIIYGQGNFLFDRHTNEFWNSGLLVKATFSEKMEIEFLPLRKAGNGVRLAEQQTADKILSEFLNRSQQLQIAGFVEQQYDKFILQNGQYYLATLAGMGKTFRRADKLLGRPFTRLIYSRRKLETVRNHFECEAHRELIIRYLQLLARHDKRGKVYAKCRK